MFREERGLRKGRAALLYTTRADALVEETGPWILDTGQGNIPAVGYVA